MKNIKRLSEPTLSDSREPVRAELHAEGGELFLPAPQSRGGRNAVPPGTEGHLRGRSLQGDERRHKMPLRGLPKFKRSVFLGHHLLNQFSLNSEGYAQRFSECQTLLTALTALTHL